ncbi:putative tetratricopeptide-like helical domain, DYW domain-containing protein [Rosa chinensis]|uniref:Putative tetratricopeptide-like helical domain, DYW domain-containing protein n=1 Tax=Rosa chinensis TaxID=74649 RepID=A0A2P6S2G8_ROSCH|nr:pentatricopeptide repeat-containing protein At3g12770-like [Rosa chinensis]XP_040371647.1 pentatricopeptide repeat-containing protein At3g12770-like [Rosa chinensis]XP_040371648.1 pentatricopeptide repeat-containing protein At3g12770-like [Rosa chinensis]XP_040371649.1 pentatricopeptide repeat-containing protein At3g12770-like [Rosa chinensis]PRQ52878.1 putative tetratricopeptide-like helical domain, DYW domain-containing protein [Rosa chinensis]
MNGTTNIKLLRRSLCSTTAHFKQQPLIPPFTSLQCGAILQSLTNTKSLPKGQKLHALMLTCGNLLRNTYLSSKLASFYASCGNMGQAHLVFDGVVVKNSFLWNFMIRGYACNGFALDSIVLYREMIGLGIKGDNFTYPFVLKACGDALAVEIGRRVHGEVVVSGFESNVYVGNALVAMYSKFGDMGYAYEVFDRMPERDLTSWNTMVSGYVKNGNPREALAVFEKMGKFGLRTDETTLLGIVSACGELTALKQGKAIHACVVRKSGEVWNEFLTNSLIEMYCKCKCVAYSRRLFDGAEVKDTVSWNSMIRGYERNGDAFESLRLFCRMVMEGAEVDEVTIVTMLTCCDQISALQFGMSVHSYLVKKGFGANVIVGTALIDMYSKCGSLSCSRRFFDDMPRKNLVSWSAMISGYGAHGRGEEAISCYHELIANKFSPDEGVLTSVLSACSHAGLVNEGKDMFNRMTREYKVKPTVAHYSCMVDLLGRAGRLDEAYELIKTIEVEPSSDIWAALLSGCRLYPNVKLAEISAQKIFEMNPEGVGSYICLSNIYAAEKRWDDVERVRAMVRKKGLKKPPGCTFVELDKMVHRFLVGDKSHPQTEDIYAKLKDLNLRLREVGYKPDTTSVLYDVEEEMKEKMLWDHSERLAIAFALINTRPGTTIRITKNLRICVDCHTVTKMISKFTAREIIMRDNHRFHHFRDGFCSCGDYW